jgi:alkylated DNA repair dioxygenase AlkB
MVNNKPNMTSIPSDRLISLGFRCLFESQNEGGAFYLPMFLDHNRSTNLLKQLTEQLDWTQESITLFGKSVLQPRLTAWLGKGLSAQSKYSQAIQASNWWPDIESVRQEINRLTAVEFNSALANWYRDGKDSMGMHADDEEAFGSCPQIASLSLGASRFFVCHHKREKDLKIKVLLEGGSLLIMNGGFQFHWKHGIPKTKLDVSSRINLTFRTVSLEGL